LASAIKDFAGMIGHCRWGSAPGLRPLPT